MTTDDETFMRHAIEASRQAMLGGNGPFGAALVKDGVLHHVAQNNQTTAGELIGHAEVALVREVEQLKGRAFLRGATVYASGEPCAMCAGALFWAGVARIVFAAPTSDINAAIGGPEIPIRTVDVYANANPVIIVDGPVLRDEAVAVLREAGPFKP